MKIKERFNQFMQGTIDTKVAVSALLLIWIVAVVAIAGVILFFPLEQTGQALQPTPTEAVPTLFLEPISGPSESTITLQGKGWPAERRLFIHWSAPRAEGELSAEPIADIVTGPDGTFELSLTLPPLSDEIQTGTALIVALASDSDIAATARFDIDRHPHPHRHPYSGGYR